MIKKSDLIPPAKEPAIVTAPFGYRLTDGSVVKRMHIRTCYPIVRLRWWHYERLLSLVGFRRRLALRHYDMAHNERIRLLRNEGASDTE